MSARWARWQLLLLVYLMFDFAHPWAPGVFFFEGDQLFVDSVVTLGKASPPRPTLAHEPRAAPRLDDTDHGVRHPRSNRDETSRRFVPRIERRHSSRSSATVALRRP